MKFVEYFSKGKNYFIAIISVTALQALAKLFSIYPELSFDFIGLSKLLVVIYAGYKLRLGVKNSALLGALIFLSIVWYVPITLPGIIFISGAFIIFSSIMITIISNTIIYSLAAMLGNLLNKKNSKKKR